MKVVTFAQTPQRVWRIVLREIKAAPCKTLTMTPWIALHSRKHVMTGSEGISRRRILTIAIGASAAAATNRCIDARARRQGLAKDREVSGHAEGRATLR
jgi:hypothetical protein